MKNILSLLADFANGIFAVLLACYIWDVPTLWWYFLVGIPLAMLPDIDAVPELLLRGRVSASAEHQRDHRTFLHYPIVALILLVPVYLFAGFWGLVLCLAVLLHLLNDLYGTGWGLQLLWPLNKKHYKFFARKANQLKQQLIDSRQWSDLTAEDKRIRLVASWSQSELPSYIQKFGQDKWIELWYLRLNLVCGVEYLLFFIAVILGALSLS